MTEVLLAVGTRKGLFIGRPARRLLGVRRGPHFEAQAVYSVAIDTRGRALGCWSAGTARTGGRRCSTPTTWAAPGPNRPGPPSSSHPTRGRRWSGCGSCTRPRPNRTWCTRARSRPRCTARRTVGSPSSWSGRCGSIPRAPSGCRAAVVRACTPCSPTRATRGRSRWPSPPRACSAPWTAAPAGRRPTPGCPPCSCRTPTRSSGSACTRWPGTRRTPTGCISRTTGASTAATTRACTGRTSARDCPRPSGSRW